MTEHTTHPHNIIELAQSHGSTAQTARGARQYLLTQLANRKSRLARGYNAQAEWRYERELWHEERRDRTADGRARVLGYKPDDPNTPGRIEARAWADHAEWLRGCGTLRRDSYGVLHLDQDQSEAHQTTWLAAWELIGQAEAAGAIPRAYDTISWDHKGKAEGSALHHELYDYGLAEAIVCIRATEGSQYGVRTLAKSYILIERLADDGIVATPTALPVAKFAKLPGIQVGQIIARVRGEAGAIKLPAPQPSNWQTCYKAVALDDEGSLRSIYTGQTYTLGRMRRQAARPNHNGGYYSYPSAELAQQAEVPSNSTCYSLPRVIVRCERAGRTIHYGNGKQASTYLRLLEIVNTN